jgi:flavin-binding protein dodecin
MRVPADVKSASASAAAKVPPASPPRSARAASAKAAALSKAAAASAKSAAAFKAATSAPQASSRVVGSDESSFAAAKKEASKATGDVPLRDLVYEAVIEVDGDLSDASKRLYRERIRSLPAATGKTVEWCLSHPKETWAALRAVRVVRKGGSTSPLSDQTLRSDASTVVGLYRRLPGLQRRFASAYGEWQRLSEAATEVAASKYEDIEPSDRQRVAHVEWSEVLAKRDELRDLVGKKEKKHGHKVPDGAHLLLSLLTYVAPSRADWGAVRVFEGTKDVPPAVGSAEEKGMNYLLVRPSGMVMVWNRYKTSKQYGRIERELPPELEAIVRASLASRPRLWLVHTREGKPHTNRSFAAHVAYVLERLFDRPATLDTVRHSFINAARIFEMTPRQMEEMARSMRHSVSMMSRYRLNFGGDKQCKMTVEC